MEVEDEGYYFEGLCNKYCKWKRELAPQKTQHGRFIYIYKKICDLMLQIGISVIFSLTIEKVKTISVCDNMNKTVQRGS